MFDPVTETWSVMASMKALVREYHSTAVLMPDGRVMMAGGNHPCPCAKTAEFYSPGYLFRGPRPVIDSAPVAVGYGQTFGVLTSSAPSIDTVVFLRLGSVTHSRNFSQRHVAMSFVGTPQEIHVTAPTDPDVAPPGYYMLFILDDGVPSEAAFVLLE